MNPSPQTLNSFWLRGHRATHRRCEAKLINTRPGELQCSVKQDEEERTLCSDETEFRGAKSSILNIAQQGERVTGS